MTSVIAMPCSAALAAGPPDVRDAAAFPPLPVLSALLRDARPLPKASSWRTGMLDAFGMTGLGDESSALIAARAIADLPQGAGVCLAAPVHVVAGMSRMFLGTPSTFSLDAVSRETLRLAFNSEFGSSDVTLQAVGSGWLLVAPFAAAANDSSPDSLHGAALSREAATCAAGRSLRRLGAEVEMWLSALPFNAARESRGEPAINSIWFWGGVTTRAIPAPAPAPGGLFSNAEPDAWMTGIASHSGLQVQQADAWEFVRQTSRAAVILRPEASRDVMEALPAWESAWLAPLQGELTSGRLAGLRLQIGGSAWQLAAPRLSRWFRRARPWWQAVSA